MALSRRSVRRYRPDPVDRADLERIVAVGLEAPTGCNGQFKEYIIVDEPAMVEKLGPVSRALQGAPAIIVQLIHPKAARFGEYWLQDAAASVMSMLLAAEAMGYASCWIEGQVRMAQEQLREILAVPPEVNVSALLPIGRPDEQPSRPQKAQFADVTHYNGYGQKKA